MAKTILMGYKKVYKNIKGSIIVPQDFLKTVLTTGTNWAIYCIPIEVTWLCQQIC
jgi:hypothetical protein